MEMYIDGLLYVALRNGFQSPPDTACMWLCASRAVRTAERQSADRTWQRERKAEGTGDLTWVLQQTYWPSYCVLFCSLLLKSVLMIGGDVYENTEQNASHIGDGTLVGNAQSNAK